ncbi:MAG TPA: methanogenesis marker protein 11 [Methanocella sp.]|nr:methanogenesis marker protein 11 [Methanocella sp.]
MKDVSFARKKWVVPYRNIVAVANGHGLVDLVEQSNCYGGACWAEYHYKKCSPLIVATRPYGGSMRYSVKEGQGELNLVSSTSAAGIESVVVRDDTIAVTYAGLGGGGVGASMSRALAEDVIDFDLTPAGGSRKSKGTIVLPRRKRVLIGVDDTDTKEEGATWSLVHNIAMEVDNRNARYMSHALVQLYPVPHKTQNCVSTVVEFGCIDETKLVRDFGRLLAKYTLSDNTGMVVLQDFDARAFAEYGELVRSKHVSIETALKVIKKGNADVLIDGRGVIGAAAALPYFARPFESVHL